jgi:hypothetical protein
MMWASFENRLRILPDGVMSKYRLIGAFIVFLNICKHSFLDFNKVEPLINIRINDIHDAYPIGYNPVCQKWPQNSGESRVVLIHSPRYTEW